MRLEFMINRETDEATMELIFILGTLEGFRALSPFRQPPRNRSEEAQNRTGRNRWRTYLFASLDSPQDDLRTKGISHPPSQLKCLSRPSGPLALTFERTHLLTVGYVKLPRMNSVGGLRSLRSLKIFATILARGVSPSRLRTREPARTRLRSSRVSIYVRVFESVVTTLARAFDG